MPTDHTPLPDGGVSLLSARPAPDLAGAGYVETEYVVRGTASSAAGDTADFATRVVVRRPADAGRFSGTLLAEWLNVSSGQDAAPDWTYLEPEILRSGHAWAGVSAQFAGVEGGGGSVDTGLGSPGLKGNDPERYGALHHPGDAYMYDIFRATVAGLDLEPERRLAIGESQAAVALTTYVNEIHPRSPLFDGFLVHSRGGAAAPLGEPGAGIVMDRVLRGEPVPIREDLDVPVLVVVTEGDLFDRIGFLPARQPDTDRFRLWEIAGAAHADRYVVGEFEEFLGCEVPVNHGQQTFVLRAALRHLDRWARGGEPPPPAPRLETTAEGFVVDDIGNVRGGVRTPAVDAPVEVLSGRPWPGASIACRLFGSTIPLPAERLRELYPDRAAYLTAYEQALDTAIRAGFLLPDDRDEILADARPHLLPHVES